ncbi:MAG: apolipoprotein N-acyltransferase [Proteobacteria bacterium]|nr:apolipoprotein N-acyltransferase [Pseudomonadota bacterium]
MSRTEIAALLLGALTVLGFAPLQLFPLPLITLGVLFVLWRHAATPRRAAWLGWLWGFGCFLGGVSWVYVSMHDVGGMPAPFAALATLSLCACLALYPALAGWLFGRFRSGAAGRDALLAAGTWTLAEWLRGWLLTGFPWLAIGYSQSPPSPLAGYAAVLGVYGISLLVAALAALLAYSWRRPGSAASAIVVLAVLAGGYLLHLVEWTEPVGAPLTVSLLQGNISQDSKWDAELLPHSLDTYAQLARTHPAQLLVLPETALPMFLDDVPEDYLRALMANGPTLFGVAMHTRSAEDPDGYTNSAVALSADGRLQSYAKSHLVPFGEYVPPGFAWFLALMRMPMSDFSAGPAYQRPLEIAGQRIAPNICYEDLFGEEILGALPEATLLVNISNTAWFGDSLAQPQHLQIARMRAMETGRTMLRATNTGMTAAVRPDGMIAAELPAFTADALMVEVRGFAGMTPFARWGNALALLLAAGALLPALSRRRLTAAGRGG